jgi:NodT family efflux transporter outer membrane factor (OMF) lipoprotein
MLAVSACTTVGPDYQAPEVEWLKHWRPSAPAERTTPEAWNETDLRFWWTLFEDPALNRLIDAARAENLALRIAGLRILESRALLGIADSSLYPQLQQIGGAVSYDNTKRKGGRLPNNTDSTIKHQLGFNLGWELDFWGRFRRGIESADAAFFSSIANQQDVQLLLSAEVADLYFAYRTTAARITIARENAAIQRRSYEITEKLFKSGAESELDLQQAKTQYLATLSSIPQLELDLIKSRNALCVLLGRPPSALPELASREYALPGMQTNETRNIPAQLLIRRPDVRAAAWQAAAQSAQIGMAEADFYPAVSLLGAFGWSGSTSNSSPDFRTLSVGPALQWNIFDYGRIGNNVRVQDARLQQLLEKYRETVLQAAREVDDAAISILKTAEQQVILDESVTTARRALELANKRYQEGYAGFQRVLDAQRALFSQTETQVTNQGSHIAALVSLYKGLGGGWHFTPTEQLIPAAVRSTMQERSDWGDLLTAPIPDRERGPTSPAGTTQHE